MKDEEKDYDNRKGIIRYQTDNTDISHTHDTGIRTKRKAGPAWLHLILILIGGSIAASVLCMGLSFFMLESAVTGNGSMNILKVTGIDRLLKPIGRIELPEEINLSGRITASDMNDQYIDGTIKGRVWQAYISQTQKQEHGNENANRLVYNQDLHILGYYQYDGMIPEETEGMIKL